MSQEHSYYQNQAFRFEAMQQRAIKKHEPVPSDEAMRKKYIKSIVGSDLVPALRFWSVGMNNDGAIIERLLEDQMLAEQPIQAMAFWGASRKPILDKADIAYMERLGRLQNAVSDIYPHGLQLEVLLADVHAGFNGKGEAALHYLQRVGEELSGRGIVPQWLKDAYQAANIQVPEVNGLVNYESPAWGVLVEADRRWGEDNNPLVRAAAAHNELGLEPRIAAYHYVEMRLLERDFLFPRVYPQAIHIAYSSGQLGELIMKPEQPVLYTGAHIPAPWFTEGGNYVQ